MKRLRKAIDIRIIFDNENYLYSVCVEENGDPISIYDFVNPSDVIEIVAELIDANELEAMNDSEES